MIDFYLSPTRSAKAAKLFLYEVLSGLKDWEKPIVINNDKVATYVITISKLKAQGKCRKELEHQPSPRRNDHQSDIELDLVYPLTPAQ